MKACWQFTVFITWSDVADLYHEMLETINELINDATDSDYLIQILKGGIIDICFDVLMAYSIDRDFYL